MIPEPKKKSGRGGARPGAGRKPGTPNSTSRSDAVKLGKIARGHTTEAIKTLVEICLTSPSDAARISAANALLDRGYGKPLQAMDHSSPDGSMKPTQIIIRAADEKRSG